MTDRNQPDTAYPSLWVELLGSEVRCYDAGGIRTRCIEAGTGPAVILLHGVGGHAEAFARNVMPLSRDFRAIALDYLGFGLTGQPATTPDYVDYVTHLIDFMDAAGIRQAHLVGESLGGWVAMWTAILHPDRVSKIISVCGAKLGVATDAESARHAQEGFADLRRRSQEFAANPSREKVRDRLDWLFAHPDRDITEELVDLRWAIYQRAESAGLPPTLRRSADQVPDDLLTPQRLAQVKCPTLMLWTSDNPTTTAATAQAATPYLADGSFTLMQDCGHWPQWEQPAAFNRIVSDFLRD